MNRSLTRQLARSTAPAVSARKPVGMVARFGWLILLAATLLVVVIAPAAAAASVKTVAKVASSSGPVAGYGYVMPLQADTVANDTLVLIAGNPGRQITAVSDTQGNAWAKDSSNGSVSIWHAVETHALTRTNNDYIAVTVSAPMSVNDAVVEELNGVDPANPVDTTAKQTYGDPGPASITENVAAAGDDDAFVDATEFLLSGRSGPPGLLQLDGAWQFDPAVNADLGPAGSYSESWTPGGATGQTWRASVLYRAYTPPAPTCSGSTPNIHEYVDGCQLYNTGSWVNSPLPASAPIDPNSASMAAKFSSQVGVDSTGKVTGATGLRWDEGVDVYVQNQTDRSNWKTVCSTEVLNGTSWAWMNDLHNAWTTFKAPIPDSVTATDGGSDHGLTLYNAPTGEMWDYYEWRGAAPAGTTDPSGHTCDYEADGGDYQNDIANHPGYFINQPLGSGVTEDNMWGRRAAALPSAVGLITPDEWNNPMQGFNHTLQLIAPCADPTKQYWPAERHDGCSSGVGGLPEGARVRIDPSVICPHGTAGSTGPTQLAYDRAYMLCRTMQTYGAVVTDQTGGGAAFMIAAPIGGKADALLPDGGNCCSADTPPGSGTQWFNWYWDVSLSHELPYLQVIDPSYRPPYAPTQ